MSGGESATGFCVCEYSRHMAGQRARLLTGSARHGLTPLNFLQPTRRERRADAPL